MDPRLQRYDGLTEGELLARILEGDDWAALHLLAVRCGPGLKYLVQFKYRTLRLELDELVNELFIRLRADGWRALRDFRGANLSGRSCGLIRYIQCIAARLLWKKMDRAVKETAWLQPLDELEDVRLPDDAAERRRLAADVIEAIMALDNPLDRQAILLYKIEGREVAEAARLLKTTPGNIHTRCSRALRKLRALLAEGGARV